MRPIVSEAHFLKDFYSTSIILSFEKSSETVTNTIFFRLKMLAGNRKPYVRGENSDATCFQVQSNISIPFVRTSKFFSTSSRNNLINWSGYRSKSFHLKHLGSCGKSNFLFSHINWNETQVSICRRATCNILLLARFNPFRLDYLFKIFLSIVHFEGIFLTLK